MADDADLDQLGVSDDDFRQRYPLIARPAPAQQPVSDDDFRQRYPLIARPAPAQQPVSVRGVSVPVASTSAEPTPPALAPNPTGATTGPNLPPEKPTIPSSPLEQQTEQDQRTQQQLAKGSGISQIGNPWARRALRGVNVAGELAGLAFPPLRAALYSIPGTEEHHDLLAGQNQRALTADQAQAEKAALTGEAAARTGLTEAQTEALKHPNPKEGLTPEETTIHDLMTGENGQPRVNPQTNQPYTYLDAYGAVKQAAQDTKPENEEQPLGDRVSQLNQMLAQRYQVLNPGQSLPKQYTIPVNATGKDYDRIDKALEAEERARGTKAQQDTVNALRQQTAQFAAENRGERTEKEGHKIVQGTDKSGRTVMVSAAEAKKLGLENIMDAPTADVSKAMSARQWIPLVAAKGTTPDQMGLLQIVDELDKKGQLGPLASRWNDFVVGTWGGGTGDPQTDALIEAMRTKIGLSQTLLMNLHVGSRGGAYMLEHFEDLANAKKLNANLLRTGIKSELNYAENRAMLPSAGGAAQGGQLQPPKAADPGMKWQHRVTNGATEWRQVPAQ